MRRHLRWGRRRCNALLTPGCLLERHAERWRLPRRTSIRLMMTSATDIILCIVPRTRKSRFLTGRGNGSLYPSWRPLGGRGVRASFSSFALPTATRAISNHVLCGVPHSAPTVPLREASRRPVDPEVTCFVRGPGSLVLLLRV